MSKITMKKRKNLRIIPLGGLNQVGLNMTLIEYDKKILIIDMGLMFPEETTPGIDYIIPNTTYLEDRRDDIVGTIITHGHYDHIGAIPYLVEKIGLKTSIYCGLLTRGIILKRQEEFPEKPKLNINKVKDGQTIKLGPFEIEFIHTNHSIPDTFALLIKTPIGNIFHTADFKIDMSPIFDKPLDLKRLEKIGEEGVLLLMSDSTRAEKEGHSFSEKEIIENLEEIFKKSKGRIIASTFASLLNRVQQIIVLSEKYGRKVAFDGRSMKSNILIAEKLGYIKMKKGTRIRVKNTDNYPDSKVTVICTGAQGEKRAVLGRIADRTHKLLRLRKKDTVIFSSSIIPGNEKKVQRLKDNVLRQTTNIFHYQMMDIHAGGHAKQEELLQIIKLLKPMFFMPIQGQYSMLVEHAKLAQRAGIPKGNIVVAENGNIINLNETRISISKNKVPASYILVDGLGVGDVGEVVLRDRERLADDGVFVVITVLDHQTGKIQNSPDIISRGFVYLKESKELLAETRKRVVRIIKKASRGKMVDKDDLKNEIRENIASFLYFKTKRRPMVLPVIIEV